MRIIDKCIDEIENVNWIAFCQVHDVKGPTWDNKRQRLFKNHIGKFTKGREPEDDWICLDFMGTTPSGRASHTTLGNTWDSVLMAEFYLHRAGIPFDKAWLHVCGDDVVI